MNQDVLVHILFKGHVQGVGFRATAFKIARELNLKGTVANLSDGSVEAYIQGQEDIIDQFLEMIKQHFANKITEVVQKRQPQSHIYDDFRII